MSSQRNTSAKLSDLKILESLYALIVNHAVNLSLQRSGIRTLESRGTLRVYVKVYEYVQAQTESKDLLQAIVDRVNGIDTRQKHRFPCEICTARCRDERELKYHIRLFAHKPSSSDKGDFEKLREWRLCQFGGE